MDSPNLSALAAALKLSPSTVSRVLSGQAERFRISPATRDRVLAEAAKSGLVVFDAQLTLEQTFVLPCFP